MARSLSLPAGFVLRTKIVLLLADGFSYQSVADKLDTSTPTVGKWKKRFLQQGLDGLETHRPGQPPYKLTARLRAKILNATRRRPTDGSTHWSCRKLAQTLGISKDLVHRVWREADLQPHRLEHYMASNDPDFERKAADVIGLYLELVRPSKAKMVLIEKPSLSFSMSTILAFDDLISSRCGPRTFASDEYHLSF